MEKSGPPFWENSKIYPLYKEIKGGSPRRGHWLQSIHKQERIIVWPTNNLNNKKWSETKFTSNNFSTHFSAWGKATPKNAHARFFLKKELCAGESDPLHSKNCLVSTWFLKFILLPGLRHSVIIHNAATEWRKIVKKKQEPRRKM